MNEMENFIRKRMLEQTTWQGIFGLVLLAAYQIEFLSNWISFGIGIMCLTAIIAPNQFTFGKKPNVATSILPTPEQAVVGLKKIKDMGITVNTDKVKI